VLFLRVLLLAATLALGGSAVSGWGPALAGGTEETGVGSSDPAELIARSAESIRTGRFEEARALLEPILQVRPDWSAGHLYVALSYYQEKHWQPALDHLRRVLEIDPNLHRARLLSGWCLYYLGELDEARGTFETYLAVEPASSEAIFALGLVAFDDDDIETAQRRFVAALELAADEPPKKRALFRTRLADVYMRTGRMDLARAELVQAVRLDPGSAKAFFKLSQVLESLGDGEGARLARARHAELRDGAATAQARSSAGDTE
jgi:tetratricopeptide (TPR) repeat protein